MSLGQSLFLAFIISFMGLDFWNGTIYISRPVFLGPLLGLLMGDLQTGLIVGGSIELMFIGALAMGAYIPPSAPAAGAMGTIFSILAGGNPEVGIALAYPVGILMQLVGMLNWNIDIFLVTKAENCLAENKIKEAEHWHLSGILVGFLSSFIVYSLAIYLGGTAIGNFYDKLPTWFSDGMSVAAGILPAIGIASLLVSMGIKKGWPFFLIGFILSAYLGLDVMAMALLGFGIAAAIAIIRKNGKTNEDDDDDDSLQSMLSSDGEEGQKIKGKLMRRIFFRSFNTMATLNYKSYMSMGFAYAVSPALRAIYPDEKEYQDAMIRHSELFNTHPYFGNLIIGVAIALEESKAHDETITDESISSIKTALMGPLAGIGDSVFQGTYRVIFSAIGGGLAMSGNAFGPIVYIIPQIILAWGSRWLFLTRGYKYGAELIVKIRQSNIFEQFVEGATIVGMMVIATMATSFISVNLATTWDISGREFILQDILDSILPNLLPMAVVSLFYWFISKKKNGVYYCLLFSFVIGFLGAIFHFM
jgi:mannose/fructose/N-acetylgalactosamine-specific phosphotransferase system component IID